MSGTDPGIDRVVDDAPAGQLPPGVPPGRPVELPGRGVTWVREAPGPPGAPTLLLLHGLGATGGVNWRRVFGQLGARYRLIAMDHRGHGRGVRARRFDLADCADDAAALLDVLGVRSVVPVGYSMGGPIAMLLWRRHPEVVDGLVLVATSQSFRQQPFEYLGFAVLGLAAAVPFGPPPWVLRRLAGWLDVDDPERSVLWVLSELRRHDPRSVLQAAVAVGRFRWPAPPAVAEAGQSPHAEPAVIDVPVAVVATTQDRVVPLARQVRMALAIPAAVLHPVDGGHGVFAVFGDREAVPTLVAACEQVCSRAARHVRSAG